MHTRAAHLSVTAADHAMRILVVDDERHNRDFLVVMLQGQGYSLSEAGSGEEALAMIAEAPPDLILLDVMMPGMNGYQVATQLKSASATRNIPVIMVTALDDRESRMRGLTAGAEDFLTKPVDRAELSVRVRNLIRLKAYADYHDQYSQALEGEVGSRTADLIESELLYRSTFDAAPVGIVHVGLDGQWVRVNQRLCDLLGYTREYLEGGLGTDCMDAEDLEAEALTFGRLLGGTLDHHVDEERRYRRHDGTFVWVRVNTSLHRDADGEPQHFISVIEDVTERRTLEAQVRQAGKMDAIGQLASGVAHDFNNLMTVILGFAELVTTDADTVKRHGRDLGEIIKAAERATGLTKQLLAFSRQQVLHTAPIDVNALITEMTGMLVRLIGEHVEVSLALTPNLPAALVDRSQLEQVVMNLVVNARDAMSKGGRVTIETATVELENSSFHEETIIAGDYVMLAVSDTGMGMSRETQRHLFEPFYTTKDTGQGTGLGLSTTYGIVKQSKGYIWVYSEIDQGTTFKVFLPRALEEAPVAVPARPTPAAANGSETVLLVEDEAGVRRLTRRILENAGYQVLEAANGDDAEVTYAEHADSIDLVLTDVIMPGCGGPELLERLRVDSPDLRVVYMSGYTEKSAAHKFGIDQGLGFVQKPFTSASLLGRVREALNR